MGWIRYKKLYLTPGDTSIDIENSETFTLRRSCAMKTAVSVNVTDRMNRLSINSPVTIPANQETKQFVAKVIGEDCSVTQLEASASSYVKARSRVEIHSKPEIKGVIPSTFPAAKKPDIQVRTTCPNQGPHIVKVYKDNLTESLTVAEISGDTLRLEGKLLEPGKWDLQLISNGWKSERLVEVLEVEHSQPRVDKFWIDAISSAITYCIDTKVRICWKVHFAKEVIIKRITHYNNQITEVDSYSNPDPLKPLEGCLTDTVDQPVDYVLEARPFGKADATITQPIRPAFNTTFVPISKLLVTNYAHEETAHIWAEGALGFHTLNQKLGTVPAGERRLFSLPNCEHFATIVSVLPSLVDLYNKQSFIEEEDRLDVDDSEVLKKQKVHSADLNTPIVAHPDISEIQEFYS